MEKHVFPHFDTEVRKPGHTTHIISGPTSFLSLLNGTLIRLEYAWYTL